MTDPAPFMLSPFGLPPLSVLFLAFLVAGTVLGLGLLHRHAHHVRRHRDAVPQPFAGSIPLHSHQRAADYTVARARLSAFHAAANAGFVLALTLGGGLQAVHDAWADVLPAGGLAHGVALLASLGVLGWLFELPFALLRTFGIERTFGFNRITPRLYLADTVREAALAALIGLPLLAAVLWLTLATGALWWAWVWAFWLGFNLLAMVIWPTFIAPLFNKFTPLADATLKARVEALLARCGFRAKGLFVMDGSRRSAHGNAYFTGLGAAKRVVFFDTLLAKLSPGEVEAVLAHELGHFKHRHVIKRIVLMFGASLLGFALLGWLTREAWFYAGLGVQPNLAAPNDALALLLFVLALPVFGFFVSPLFARLSRRHEFEADAYACAQASSADLAAAL
nr:M48 family metallopeptidase [Thauera sp.]